MKVLKRASLGSNFTSSYKNNNNNKGNDNKNCNNFPSSNNRSNDNDNILYKSSNNLPNIPNNKTSNMIIIEILTVINSLTTIVFLILRASCTITMIKMLIIVLIIT